MAEADGVAKPPELPEGNLGDITFEQSLFGVTGAGADMHAAANKGSTESGWFKPGAHAAGTKKEEGAVGGTGSSYYAWSQWYFSVDVNETQLGLWESAFDEVDKGVKQMADRTTNMLNVPMFWDAKFTVDKYMRWLSTNEALLRQWVDKLTSDDSAFKGKAAYAIRQKLEQTADNLADLHGQIVDNQTPLALQRLATQAAKYIEEMTAIWSQYQSGLRDLLRQAMNLVSWNVYTYMVEMGLIHGTPQYALDMLASLTDRGDPKYSREYITQVLTNYSSTWNKAPVWSTRSIMGITYQVSVDGVREFTPGTMPAGFPTITGSLSSPATWTKINKALTEYALRTMKPMDAAAVRTTSNLETVYKAAKSPLRGLEPPVVLQPGGGGGSGGGPDLKDLFNKGPNGGGNGGPDLKDLFNRGPNGGGDGGPDLKDLFQGGPNGGGNGGPDLKDLFQNGPNGGGPDGNGGADFKDLFQGGPEGGPDPNDVTGQSPDGSDPNSWLRNLFGGGDNPPGGGTGTLPFGPNGILSPNGFNPNGQTNRSGTTFPGGGIGNKPGGVVDKTTFPGGDGWKPGDNPNSRLPLPELPGGGGTVKPPLGGVGNLPGGNTGNLPGGNTGNLPGGNIGNLPGGNIGNLPGGNIGNLPGGNVGNLPGGHLGNLPGGNVGNLPGGAHLPGGGPGGAGAPDFSNLHNTGGIPGGGGSGLPGGGGAPGDLSGSTGGGYGGEGWSDWSGQGQGGDKGSPFGPGGDRQQGGGMPMMPPMMPPNAGNQGDSKERERQTWLSEDDKIWGTDALVGSGVIGLPTDAPHENDEPLAPTHVHVSTAHRAKPGTGTPDTAVAEQAGQSANG